MNTKEKGLFRFVVFQEKNDYVGVCLDLDIVEYGNNPEKLMESIKEAAFSYLGAVRSENLPDKYLNRFAPKKYWNKLKSLSSKTFFSPTKFSRLTQVKPDQACFFSSILAPYSQLDKNYC